MIFGHRTMPRVDGRVFTENSGKLPSSTTPKKKALPPARGQGFVCALELLRT